MAATQEKMSREVSQHPGAIVSQRPAPYSWADPGKPGPPKANQKGPTNSVKSEEFSLRAVGVAAGPT